MKKGFTLIELLSVIVVLSIILVIAVPQVLKVMEQSKVGSIEGSAKLVADYIGKKAIQTGNNSIRTVDCNTKEYGLGTSDYQSCTAFVTYNDNATEVNVSIIGSRKFAGYVVNAVGNNSTSAKIVAGDSYLKDTLIATVGGKDVSVNKYAGNGLYKNGTEYLYRGGITKTNANGLATADYATDVDSGNDVNNFKSTMGDI